MTDPKKPKEHRLNIRLSEQEWKKIQHHASNTTCRNVSEYCRKVLLNKPVKVFYRNQSFDDFEEELVRILPILNTYGEDLHQLIRSPQLAAHLPTIMTLHKGFMDMAGNIKELLIKIADTCAQTYNPAKAL